MDFKSTGTREPKLNAKQLRDLSEPLKRPSQRNPIYFILDDVYDTYNIGGLFRLADGLNVSKLYICGASETPPNHRIKKASIGTYKIVPWEYKRTAVEAIETLRKEQTDIQVVAIEQDKKSVPYTQVSYSFPLALVAGNETRGCSPETLAAADTIAEIPMFGINVSLNVIVSTAIVGYHAIGGSDNLKSQT